MGAGSSPPTYALDTDVLRSFQLDPGASVHVVQYTSQVPGDHYAIVTQRTTRRQSFAYEMHCVALTPAQAAALRRGDSSDPSYDAEMLPVEPPDDAQGILKAFCIVLGKVTLQWGRHDWSGCQLLWDADRFLGMPVAVIDGVQETCTFPEIDN